MMSYRNNITPPPKEAKPKDAPDTIDGLQDFIARNLTRRESALFRLFVRHSVVNNALIEANGIEKSNARVMFSNIRKKLPKGWKIKNKHGSGYSLINGWKP
jgi:DNA-binding response OmpR family regulator